MKRILFFAYGVIAYFLFFGVFNLFIAFIGGLDLVNGLDAPPKSDLGYALMVDLLLIALFTIPHSIMARPAFKQWLTRFIPNEIERSTYVFVSSVLLFILVWYWEPLGGVVWQVNNPILGYAIYGVYFLGWGILFLASFLINHFDLFGLRQVYLYLVNKPYTHLTFTTPFLYKYVRHPMMLGMLMGLWFVPTMTLSHLALALGMTLYTLVGIRYEEKDLATFLGDSYRHYQKRVPMVFPFLKPRNPVEYPAQETEIL